MLETCFWGADALTSGGKRVRAERRRAMILQAA